MQKVSRDFTCCIFIWFVFSLAGIYAQTDITKKQEAYQNQQRASNLALLRSDIKLVDDAPQRCSLRVKVMEFIFKSNVKNYYEVANSLALECLDETVDNADQFSASTANWWKNNVLSLLRKYSPEVAAKAETKYFVGNQNDLADELDVRKDPNGVANRLISKIARSRVSPSIVSIIYQLRSVNNTAALRLLRAVLDYYESHFEEAYSDNNLIFLSSDYLSSDTPVELRKRFHNFTVRLGEAALADPKNDELSRLGMELLKNALSDIKLLSPELYPKAFSIYTALNSKKTDYQKEKDEVMERIRASKDKLAQTISEAESATNKSLKTDLWLYASQYALEAKRFRTAADSRLKIDVNDNEFLKKTQFFFLIENVLDPCLKEGDIESAEYIVGLVEDLEMKGKGLFKIAAKLVELKKIGPAFDNLSEGLKLVEKMETSVGKVLAIKSAIPIALQIDKNRAFDLAGDLVKVVNRFPTPGPDDKQGTEARKKYVSDTVTPISYNLDSVFGLLGKENMALADPISQGLQLKEFRLAAQIAIETQRIYPLPPELEKKPKQTDK